MINNDNINKAIKIANELNNQSLFIPLIDGFSIKMKSENGFLAANKNNFTEKFATSNANGSLDELIEKDINSTINYGRDNNAILDKKNIKFYGNYNYSFQYKLYFRDILVNNNSFIREAVVYFINDHNNTFNVISLSTCLFSLNDIELLMNIDNLSDDKFVKNLFDDMMLIIENIK